MKVDVTYFPKKCPHGEMMRVIRKLGGRWWYEAINCSDCDAEERAKEEESEKRTDAFLKRLAARRAAM